jgi:hypothetical protein
VRILLHATVYLFLHNLLNVLIQIENKMGLQKKFGMGADVLPSVMRCLYCV